MTCVVWKTKDNVGLIKDFLINCVICLNSWSNQNQESEQQDKFYLYINPINFNRLNYHNYVLITNLHLTLQRSGLEL